MSNLNDFTAVAAFVDVLESLDIEYAIGGSIASSVHGCVRFTQDADVTVVPFDQKIDAFCDALAGDFYLSKEAIRQAHHRSGSFNVIHFNTAFKVDVFIGPPSLFQKQILLRSRKMRLDESFPKEFKLVSPEDIILLKLQWYKDGGAVSERQWNDIQGVLESQRETIDIPYLKQWAQKLSLSDLLENALRQARNT